MKCILAASLLMTAASAAADGRCRHLPSGPQRVTLETEVVYLSEDIAFDGGGLLVAKKGDLLVGVPSRGPSVSLSRDPALSGLSLGLRYRAGGDLVVAMPAVAEGLVATLLLVHPDGTTSVLLDANGMPRGAPPLIIPNGVAADLAGNVWVTDEATSHVFEVGPDGAVTSIVVGDAATDANGILFDDRRGLLFYDSTALGTVSRVAWKDGVAQAPQVIATIPGGALDGLALDACGNLYAAGKNQLWRIPLDAAGRSAGAPVSLATFDETVSSAQFGRGRGYDEESLYVTSVVGKVFRVPVGIAGAPIPLPRDDSKGLLRLVE